MKLSLLFAVATLLVLYSPRGLAQRCTSGGGRGFLEIGTGHELGGFCCVVRASLSGAYTGKSNKETNPCTCVECDSGGKCSSGMPSLSKPVPMQSFRGCDEQVAKVAGCQSGVSGKMQGGRASNSWTQSFQAHLPCMSCPVFPCGFGRLSLAHRKSVMLRSGPMGNQSSRTSSSCRSPGISQGQTLMKS
jgi:hypothetical protein